MEGLLIVLVPMLLGYLIKTTNQQILKRINNVIMILLLIILFVMGISLGQLDDLARKLPMIGISALIFIICILSCNIVGLITYDKFYPQPLKHLGKDIPPRWKLLLDSFKLCSMVIIGFIFGLITKGNFELPLHASTYVLIVLIFFVGVQLRNNGISLREVLFNKRGIYTGLIMISTSLIGGILASLWLNLPISQGLAIASGLGWYSLSSVVINDAWGPVFGSIAFFNDLSREVFSLFIIPFFIFHYRSTAVGLAGATALDCTLPIIQRSGGIEVVPLAISFGFITNIAPPILLVFFSSIPI
ncbi:lysine exporter LysO family protein [Mannheimia massilioguelmaensis]|uniref:lysine exporter LysO family protein n=1 Tax=Mannheimia massilioguelmaensis TaxID=1604354 RepID=UPI0005C905DA|nr:lysine exporter LysO family protein [Mannheimia massilioguelmaensis]